MTHFDADVPDAPHSHKLPLLRSLQEDLLGLDYSVEGVSTLIGPDADAALARDQLVPARLVCREAGGSNGLAAVVLLWLLGGTLSAGRIAGALPRTGVQGLLALRLIEEHDGGYRAKVDLRPYASDAGGDLWVASDLGSHQRQGVLRRDHVLGIGQASLTLAQLTAAAAHLACFISNLACSS